MSEAREMWEKVKMEDLDVSLSLGFVCRGTLASFLSLREIINKFFENKKGEFLVYATASSSELKIIKNAKEAIRVEQIRKRKGKPRE